MDAPLLSFQEIFKPTVYKDEISHLIKDEYEISYTIGKQLPVDTIELIYKKDYPILLACWITTGYTKRLTVQLAKYLKDNYNHWSDLRNRQIMFHHHLFTYDDFYKMQYPKGKGVYHERDIYYKITDVLDRKKKSGDKSISYYKTEGVIE